MDNGVYIAVFYLSRVQKIRVGKMGSIANVTGGAIRCKGIQIGDGGGGQINVSGNGLIDIGGVKGFSAFFVAEMRKRRVDR